MKKFEIGSPAFENKVFVTARILSNKRELKIFEKHKTIIVDKTPECQGVTGNRTLGKLDFMKIAGWSVIKAYDKKELLGYISEFSKTESKRNTPFDY